MFVNFVPCHFDDPSFLAPPAVVTLVYGHFAWWNVYVFNCRVIIWRVINCPNDYMSVINCRVIKCRVIKCHQTGDAGSGSLWLTGSTIRRHRRRRYCRLTWTGIPRSERQTVSDRSEIFLTILATFFKRPLFAKLNVHFQALQIHPPTNWSGTIALLVLGVVEASWRLTCSWRKWPNAVQTSDAVQRQRTRIAKQRQSGMLSPVSVCHRAPTSKLETSDNCHCTIRGLVSYPAHKNRAGFKID